LRAARAATDKPLVAYPNGGDTWDAAIRRWETADVTGGYDARAVASWTALGASWLGGCCGTGPADIAALAGAVHEGVMPIRSR
jgi:S-methylmethionine-dependent homocysteine/selenocysteine methylase